MAAADAAKGRLVLLQKRAELVALLRELVAAEAEVAERTAYIDQLYAHLAAHHASERRLHAALAAAAASREAQAAALQRAELELQASPDASPSRPHRTRLRLAETSHGGTMHCSGVGPSSGPCMCAWVCLGSPW